MPITPDIVPDGVEALKAALVAERQARQEAEARATGAEAMVAHLKLVIAKLRRERFGPSAERGAKLLDQLELQLEELEASATEDELAAQGKSAEEGTIVTSFTRKKPVRAPFPEHLSRERVVIPAPAACPCCGGKLAKLGEDVTETLGWCRGNGKSCRPCARSSPVAAVRRSPSSRHPSIPSRVVGPAPACWR